MEEAHFLAKILRKWTGPLLICVGGWPRTLLGLVILFSSTQFFVKTNYFTKQCFWLTLAMPCFLASAYINLEKIRKYIWIISGISLFLLILVLIPTIGIKVNGANRWLGIGFLRFQVSELGKFALILSLSHYLASNQRKLGEFKRGFCFPCAIIGVFCTLIIIEPDFGTAFLCGCVGFLLIFMAGVKLMYLIPPMLSAIAIFSISVALNPIRLKRITSFLNVEDNKSAGAYQLWQGIVGFCSGGFTGVGLGNGRQHHHFLPESHTDFIFPVIGEELGLLFALIVVLLFAAIFAAGFLALRKTKSLFFFCMGMGALLFIILQALINMGVVMGLLPTKGISLPFLSYGGSNLLLMFMLLGIIINCMRHTENTLPIAEEI